MKISPARQRKILEDAVRIMEHHARYGNDRMFLESPDAVKRLFTMRSFDRKQEVFTVAFLDNRHRLIEIKDMFFGTIDSASVYPREIVRESILLNAAAIVLAHNHPSGIAQPSRADITITKKIKDAMALVDVRVLDHIITGNACAVSLAERGEM